MLLVAALAVAACGDDAKPDYNVRQRPGPTLTTSSTPFTGTTLADGEVVRVENLDGARLQPVDKGVVRSFETSVEVTEIGRADRLGAGDAAYAAKKGGGLVVFTMTTSRNKRSEELDGDVVAAVSVDNQQRELPDFSSASDADGKSVNYAVAVPDDRVSVELQLKYNGVVQSFDLLEGKPIGKRPKALYRATAGTVVYQEALAPSQFSVQVHETAAYTYTVSVSRAELGYFPVKGTENPSSDDNAWLTMWVSADASPSTCVAPISAYTFTAEDGTVYKPAQAASDVPSEPGVIDSPVSIVAFEVPADLAKGKLTVSAPQVTCQTSTATYNQVPATGAATIDVSLPEN